ncbi:MAG: cytochrome c [Bacteroidetes bacterium]|nr:cytochrome c [Bacteroidota bacterium]
MNKYLSVSSISLFIFFYSCQQKDPVTFSEHIAPIIYKNCTTCHRPGSAGSFSLITYRDVAKRAKMIGKVTASGLMPPWPADNTYTHFIDEKVLTEGEISLIQQWAEAGAPLGDTTKLQKAPEYIEGSMLGKPDLVVKMPVIFNIKGDNKDNFMLMKIPFELPNDTFVRAIEFVPGNRKLVHHVNGHLLRYEYDKKKNINDGEKIVDTQTNSVKESYDKLRLANDDGTYPLLKQSFVNYLPGVMPVKYPDGIGGFVLNRKNAILLKDIHYGPSPIDTSDQSWFNIFFDKEAPKRPTLELQLGTLGVSEIIPPLVIPPNEIKTFYTRTVAPMDMSILTINPHMHLLGKTFWAYALTPQGDTIPLIRIKKWDFRWQYFYTFKKMVKIPRGSVITAVGVYDNTSNNPNNPFNPPQLVQERSGSMRTTDEMFQFIITYLPYRTGDENVNLGGN